MTPKMFDFTLTFGGRDLFDNPTAHNVRIAEYYFTSDNLTGFRIDIVEYHRLIRLFSTILELAH